MSTRHTVRSFEEALSGVRQDVLEMGRLTLRQVQAAAALLTDEPTTAVGPEAGAIGDLDELVDDFDEKVEGEVQRILALRQPMADDLRSLLACDRIATDLERIADHAKNIALRTNRIHASGMTVDFAQTRQLAAAVAAQLEAMLQAIEHGDAEAARAIWLQDEGIDRLFETTFAGQLETMCKTPETAPACTNALFIAKALERIGDHVTNIAEDLVYWITGERLNKRATADNA